MIEVYHNLFVGNQTDYELSVSGQTGWAVVHACKDPYHRQALGYTTQGAPKDHPEYYVARRGNRLMLNIVDVNNPSFYKTEMIVQVLDFIEESLSNGSKVLVHCNMGESRSPAIALLFMASRLKAISNESLDTAETEFKRIYPMYNPNRGLREYLRQQWSFYCTR